jgi:uncharacterized protein
MEVRDPVHGVIPIDRDEIAIVDHPFVQRLRNIKQTGFSHLPFPGATHTRYAHVLGAMHLAGVAFDAISKDKKLPAEARKRLRSAVRLAALCHDLGHAPFSHCTEFAMPPLADLGIEFYDRSVPRGRKAHHEDYTIAILERTSLAELIGRTFPFDARHIAALISDDVAVTDDFFTVGGLDWRRVLAQLVSGEIDVDRLDYLRRDSYFTGARYGQIDADWILSNLVAVPHEGTMSLALDSRAIYAFDDFLIARHHMFLQVYFHHKSVVFEEMLKRYVTSKVSTLVVPSALDDYLQFDDIALEMHLRQATNIWARRIVERRPWRRVLEKHGAPDEVDLEAEKSTLFDAGIGVIHTASTGRLSRYTGPGPKKAPPILVLDRMPGQPVERVRPLSEASDVFDRYADVRRIARLYVAPEEVGKARQALGLPTS